MIPNASFENEDALGPVSWARGYWGTNTPVFTYPVAGHTGEKAAEVSVSGYSSGDAKWFFADVPVEPGKIYEFSDWYKSDIESNVGLRYTLADSSFVYLYVEQQLPASLEWKQFTSTITPVENAVSVTVYHTLETNGVLTVDDFYFAEQGASSSSSSSDSSTSSSSSSSSSGGGGGSDSSSSASSSSAINLIFNPSV